MSDWFYGKDGTQHGPVSDQEIGTLVASGQIDSNTIVWREGMPDWLPLAQVPEFQSLNQTGAADPYGSPQSQPVQPGQTPYTAPIPTDGLSIASLVCGILAIISCYIWGLFGLPAVICGHMSLKKIKNSATPIQGKGMALAGLICGYIGIVIQIVAIIGILFFFLETKKQVESEIHRIESTPASPSYSEEVSPDTSY